MVGVEVWGGDPTSGDATKIGDVTGYTSLSWLDELTGPGHGSLTTTQQYAAELISGRHVHVIVDNVDVFAFVIDSVRTVRDDVDELVTVDGPGVLSELDAGAVLGEHWTAGNLDRVTGDYRMFGFMAAHYDDTAWANAVSVGLQGSTRQNPAGWIDPAAHRIWGSETSVVGTSYFRKEWTTTIPRLVLVMASAATEFELWVDGVSVLSSADPRSHRNTYQRMIPLQPGTHVAAARVTNLRPDAQPWFIASLLRVDSEGEPIIDVVVSDATNEIQDVIIKAASTQPGEGVFQLRFDGQTSADIAYDADTATIKSAFEALSTVDEVAFTRTPSSGGPVDTMRFEFVGSHAGEPQPLIELIHDRLSHARQDIIRVQAGGTTATEVPFAMLRTDDTWKVLSYPEKPPGMTPGQIMKLVIDQNHDSGYLPNITYSFTGTVDSATNGWPKEYEVQMQVGQSVLRLAELLTDLGVDVTMNPDLTLDMFHHRGVITGNTLNRLTLKHTVEAGRVYNSLLARSQDGWSIHEDDTSIGTLHARRFGYVQLGTAPSNDSTLDLIAHTLADMAQPRQNTTVAWADADTTMPTPYTHFVPGDELTAPARTGTLLQRVISIAADVDEAGNVEWVVEVAP